LSIGTKRDALTVKMTVWVSDGPKRPDFYRHTVDGKAVKETAEFQGKNGRNPGFPRRGLREIGF
jgi:hypothetical protein